MTVCVRSVLFCRSLCRLFTSAYLGQDIKLIMLVEKMLIILERFLEVPNFFNHAIADGIYNLLYPDKTVLEGIIPNRLDDFQLCFDFG